MDPAGASLNLLQDLPAFPKDFNYLCAERGSVRNAQNSVQTRVNFLAISSGSPYSQIQLAVTQIA
jgi:hypothetical protein